LSHLTSTEISIDFVNEKYNWNPVATLVAITAAVLAVVTVPAFLPKDLAL
jgi:hypothetical protein